MTAYCCYISGLLAADMPDISSIPHAAWWIAGAILFLIFISIILGIRSIPNNCVGIIEKKWSGKGSVTDGRIIALNGEAGYQADLLRGGVHLFYWPWQYRIHKVSLVIVPQGKIGYAYARDGDPLPPSQTLGRVVDCNHFQDARKFLGNLNSPQAAVGQRGRQRVILREGVYAINVALFVVVTQDCVYRLDMSGRQELATIVGWQKELNDIGGFDPVVIGAPVTTEDQLTPGKTMMVDSIGIVTIHDGPSLAPGEIIAPAVGNDSTDPNYHNNFQDPEAFLRAGGRRGRQYVPLTDGTYFINRWFATIEIIGKTVVPIGYVGVIVSYYGPMGADVSGEGFRHGERVARGERGVWEKPLGPGKYPFNTYAGKLMLVPTTNFVLHWITGKTESHHFDESLRSIDLVTKDAYEPLLPLSIVVHIDYQRAPNVIQRFGDVKKLITQTLDPMLSAYFRDVAHKKTMLELLQHRDDIQIESRNELQSRFREFDIECVDVLIGKPDTAEGTGTGSGKIETLLEQLRMRQLSIEQLETYDRQRAAAEKLRSLTEAQAIAAKQAELTNSQVQIRIAENQGDADLSRSRKQAEQTIVVAEAELARARRQAEQTVVTAQADSQSRILAGRGESTRSLQVGLAEATVLLRSITSFGDPRLYALTKVAEHLSHATQPLVPDRVFSTGGQGADGQPSGGGMLGTLMALLVAEKSGFAISENSEGAALNELADKMTRQVLATLEERSGNGVPAE
ncbi:MAG TPA: SPFH domain-containing protein [Tepidisphaeraceae bacterium]|jgi:uncharacterized membrane protein YqiK